MTAEPRDELHRLVDEIVMAPGWREALRAAVAAADQENADLRGECERAWQAADDRQREAESQRSALYGSEAARLITEKKLAAAQAQLAEFDRECYERSLEQQDALARLEAVRAAMNHPDVRCLCGHESRLHAADRERRCTETADRASWHCPCRTFHPTSIPTSLLDAALSAAPQPEPERDARVGDTVTATLRGTLIAYDTDLGKWTLETDGTDHIAWQIELHWAQPFEVVQREPESPASDEPARCSTCGGSFDSPGCCKSPDDDRPRAEAGFHTIDGGPVTSDGPR